MSFDRVLREITTLVVRCLDPDEVVLFGSVAKGTASLHSDVDLLVVGSFSGTRHRRGSELRGLLDRFPLRVDLHLLTRAELADDQARRPHFWLETLRSSAISLYARDSENGKDPRTL